MRRAIWLVRRSPGRGALGRREEAIGEKEVGRIEGSSGRKIGSNLGVILPRPIIISEEEGVKQGMARGLLKEVGRFAMCTGVLASKSWTSRIRIEGAAFLPLAINP